METKYFTLLELLKAREYLTAVMSSTRSFVHVALDKEQISNARLRLKEIDQELVKRLMGSGWQEPMSRVFQDEDFEETLKSLSKEEPEEKGSE